MPLYCHKCEGCGHKDETYQCREIRFAPICPECGKLMVRDWQAEGFTVQDVPIDSVDFDLTGKPLVYHTRGQLKKIARQHGCRVDFGQRSRAKT